MTKIGSEGFRVVRHPEDIGQLVRSARQAMGLSQEAGALLAGVGTRFLSEFERGKGTVQLAKAIQVAQAFGIRLGAGRVR